MRSWLVAMSRVVLCSVVLIGAGLSPARATDVAAEATAQSNADPAVWGVYARLLNVRWQRLDENLEPVAESTIWTFQWSKPGQEMIETASGAHVVLRRIERGSEPGELFYWDRSSGLERRYVGTVQPDGAVLFVHKGIVTTAFRVLVNAEGRMEHQWVKLKDGQVSVRDRYTRFYRNVGDEAATQVAATTTDGATRITLPAGEPAVATAAAPASPDELHETFGDIVRYAGQRLVARTYQIEVQLKGNDALVIQYYSASGVPGRRYDVRRSPKKPGELVLVESAYGNDRMKAQRNSDGSLFVESQEGWTQGYRVTRLFESTERGLKSTFSSEYKNQLRITISSMGRNDDVDFFKPYTDELAIEAEVAARMKVESDRIAAENRRREQREHNDRVAAAFSGFVQGMSQGMASNNQAYEQQQAFLSETAVRAQVIAEMRQKQLQREARAANANVSAQAARATAPGAVAGASNGEPPAKGESTSGSSSASRAGSGAIVVEEKPAPPVAPKPVDKSRVLHMMCMFIGPTKQYEKDHTATLYFSQVTRFEVVGALSLGPPAENFGADLRARYGDVGLGLPVCDTGTEQEMAEARSRQDTIRPRYKKESTGIPLRQ